MAQQEHARLTPVQKEKIVENIQGAFQEMTPIEEQNFIDRLPLKDSRTFEADVGFAIVRGKRTASIGVFVTVLIGLLISIFFPTKSNNS